ncbi:hypothetical protein J6590_054214, partial [Homalodisca vitripennis]
PPCSTAAALTFKTQRQNRDVYGRPLQCPEIFCHLQIKFTPLLEFLTKHPYVLWLAVILDFNYGVGNDTFYH